MKNISIVKKKVLFSVLVLFIIISVLLNGGCSVNKDTVDTIETITEITTETTVKSTEETAENTQATETDYTENTEPAQDTDLLTFKGNDVNGNTAVLILEVNIETGEVQGIIQMGFSGFDLNMSSTKICDYVLTGKITGTLDPDTLGIIGVLNGRAETDTKVNGCNDYNVEYSMTAEMMEDYSRIKGYFDPKTQDKYEFFLKNISK